MKQTHLIGLAAFGMLALAGCTTTSPNYGSSGYGSSAPYPSQARCADCGLVTRIDVVASNRSAPSATGAILGGSTFEGLADPEDPQRTSWHDREHLG